MPRPSTQPVPKKAARNTAVPAAAGAKPRQSKSRFSSLGRKDRSTSTAAKMPMVSHCMESGR